MPAGRGADLYIMECYAFDGPTRYHMSWQTISANLARIGAPASAADAHEHGDAGQAPSRRHGAAASSWPRTASSSSSEPLPNRARRPGSSHWTLVADIRAAASASKPPTGKPLPHEPRPVLRVSADRPHRHRRPGPGHPRAHIRHSVHRSLGRPAAPMDGRRRRGFYDAGRIAIMPMGFCFPGHDAKGGDLPPRRECAPRWRAAVCSPCCRASN